MPKLSAETIWNMPPKGLENLLNSWIFYDQNKKFFFYAPSFSYFKTASFCVSSNSFPSVSVTGNGCALNCKHCGGRILKTMHSTKSPEILIETCTRLRDAGAKGILISGGCMPDGSVPLQNFSDAIAKIRRDLGLTVFVHTGIIDADTAFDLKAANVDAVLIDVIGSDATIREIYNLNATTKEYENSLKVLNEVGITFVPHVVVGLHNGKLKGEFFALKMIKPYKPSAIVVISFMPIPNTPMAKIIPPSPQEIARAAATARVMFPNTPIVLGCMRPKGKHRRQTDLLTLKAGVDGIAFPSEEAIRYAENRGFNLGFSSFCCAQIYRDLMPK
jgi:lipoyl synthase